MLPNMFGSLCKKLCWNPHLKIRIVGNSNIHLEMSQYGHNLSVLIHNIESFSSSSLSELPRAEGEHQSFTVSYLINSCHLSLEDAISASSKVKFKTSKKPDSLLAVLKAHGFTKTHISKVVKKRPQVLVAHPKNTILPKLEFFNSMCIPSIDLVRTLSYDPSLFYRSLKYTFIPTYNLLKTLLGTNEKVVMAFRRSSIIFKANISKTLIPNIALLEETGMPQSSILSLVIKCPNVAFLSHKRFKDSVNYIKEIGFDPTKSAFAEALEIISLMRHSTWEQKLELYSRWGWSKEEAKLAFKSQPRCMKFSEKRIISVMDFLVNKMGWPSKLFARKPVLLCYSLDKRIIPRCSIFQALLFKGMIEDSLSLCNFIRPKEEYFLQRCVTRYQENFPQLMDLYEGKIDLVNLGIGPEEKSQMKKL